MHTPQQAPQLAWITLISDRICRDKLTVDSSVPHHRLFLYRRLHLWPSLPLHGIWTCQSSQQARPTPRSASSVPQATCITDKPLHQISTQCWKVIVPQEMQSLPLDHPLPLLHFKEVILRTLRKPFSIYVSIKLTNKLNTEKSKKFIARSKLFSNCAHNRQIMMASKSVRTTFSRYNCFLTRMVRKQPPTPMSVQHGCGNHFMHPAGVPWGQQHRKWF